MERVEHRIKLNLMKTGLQGQVNVKKADTDSRKVCIYLSYAAKPVDLNDVVSAVLRAEKPDGKVMFNSCTVCEDRLEYIITTLSACLVNKVHLPLYYKKIQNLPIPLPPPPGFC